jgi:arabinofuranosyltransferase
MSFPKHFAFFFCLILVLTVACFFYIGRPTIGIDDANIFFTYARNIAGGHGFVFNVGGERVEGFTSLLWVLVCALAYTVSSNPEFILLVVLFFCTTLAVTIVYRELKFDLDSIDPVLSRKYGIWIYSLFIACISPSYITWSVLSLMENGLWNLIYLLNVILALRAFRKPELSSTEKLLLPLSAVLLQLTRPEGLAWGLVFTLIIAIGRWRNRKNLFIPAIYLLAAGVTAAALTMFRLKYFGAPLPNTYYAKVSHDLFYNIKNGAEYAYLFIITYHPLITILLSVMVVFSLRSRKAFLRLRTPIEEDALRQRIGIVTIIILIGVLIPFTTGGDHFGSFRFYQSFQLLFAWGIIALMILYREAAIKKTKSALVSVSLCIVLFLGLFGAGGMYNLKSAAQNQLNYEFYLAWQGRRIATEVNALWPGQPPSTGMVAVGGFAYKYRGTTVDLMGLNDTLMGHNKGDRTGIKNHAAFNKDVFYHLQPQLLLPKILGREEEAEVTYTDLKNEFNFENRALKNILNDSAFNRLYEPVMLRKNPGPPLFAFAHKSFLDKIKGDSMVTIVKIR